MADKHEKLLLPKDVALTILKKVGELLQKSELAKKYEGFKAVEESARESGARDPKAVAAAVGRKKYGKKAFQEAAAKGHKMGKAEGSYSMDPAPQDPTTVKKAENPDKEADAKLGEKVEHEVEDHMLENKDVEQKEGHKIVKCETCGTMHKAETKHDRCVEHVKGNSPGVKNAHAVCVAEGVKPSTWGKSEELSQDFESLKKLLKNENYDDPSCKTGQGDTLKPSKSKVDWQEKSEKMTKYETENSKKLGYKTSEAGNKERDPEQSDRDFKVEGKDHKSSDTHSLRGQTNPHENKKEQAEGNNEEAGTTPTQVGQDGKNKPGYDEMKGHLKLAKFLGYMEHKRKLSGTQSQTDSSAQHADSIRDKKNG